MVRKATALREFFHAKRRVTSPRVVNNTAGDFSSYHKNYSHWTHESWVSPEVKGFELGSVLTLRATRVWPGWLPTRQYVVPLYLTLCTRDQLEHEQEAGNPKHPGKEKDRNSLVIMEETTMERTEQIEDVSNKVMERRYKKGLVLRQKEQEYTLSQLIQLMCKIW